MAKMGSEGWVIRLQVDSLLAGSPDQICIFCVGSLSGRPRVVPEPVLVNIFYQTLGTVEGSHVKYVDILGL